MNQIRSQLTRLRKKVAEVLPDGDDIFQFPGVNKVGILDYLDRSYQLTERIESLRKQFPIVVLKRKLRPHLDTCRMYLDEDIEGKKTAEKFDEFLKSITRIHDEISLTHTVFLSETLRTDAELEEVRMQTKTLQDELSKAQPGVDELLTKLTRIEELHESVETNSEEIDECLKTAEESKNVIIEAANTATVKAEVITKYEAETKTQKSDVVALAARLSGLEKKLKSLLAESQSHVRDSEENLKQITDLEAINLKQQQRISQTLTLASKFGMAASFKERKDELHKPMWIWGAVFTLTIVGIFITSAVYVVPQFEDFEKVTTGSVLIKITLIAPLVWLGWVAAKQYGYLSRIREDYSFKYASALAFEGYKREAVDVDANMLGQLLSVATENMSLNPLRIYGDEDNHHASPAHEALSKIFKKEAKASSAKPPAPVSNP